MLYAWIREYIEKYSFVKRTKFKDALFYIYYEKNGKDTYKVLPFRANKKQLQTCIESIKKDINYYEKKQERIDAGDYDVSKDHKPFCDVI